MKEGRRGAAENKDDDCRTGGDERGNVADERVGWLVWLSSLSEAKKVHCGEALERLSRPIWDYDAHTEGRDQHLEIANNVL